MEAKKYKVPVIWSMMGYVTVVANSPEEARHFVENNTEELPDNGQYLEDSFQIDEEGEPIPFS